MAIEYINIFTNLIQHKESEVVEFKKAENNFDFDDLGKYFSALSNEANLRGLDFAWLIFGYDEKNHEIVGTSYKNGEGASIDRDGKHLNDNHDEDIAPIDDAVTPVVIIYLMIPTILRNLMIWIYSCAIITARIVQVCITESMTVIIIAAVVIVPIMIGILEVIINRLRISMTSRTTTI